MSPSPSPHPNCPLQTPDAHFGAGSATPRPHPRHCRASAFTGSPSNGAGSQRPPDARARRSCQLAPRDGLQHRLATRVSVSAARRQDTAPAHNNTTHAPRSDAIPGASAQGYSSMER
ncbi:hypothetical protein PLICRDRAFT_34799 [Plicaturopsis crispa FD-325 SS-3]|nr:hypothetical protein PLICRDRAFT_34799 [Plicaturopsis crispa FD-325 SS-3]